MFAGKKDRTVAIGQLRDVLSTRITKWVGTLSFHSLVLRFSSLPQNKQIEFTHATP
jgi:hypothetical protein